MNLKGRLSYLHNWAGSCKVLWKIKIYSPNRMALFNQEVALQNGIYKSLGI